MQIDDRLKALRGLPIEVDKNISIKPLTVGEIVEVGYTNYMRYLQYITLDKKQFNIVDEQITTLDCYILSQDEYIIEEVRQALMLFLKTNITIINGYVIYGEVNIEDKNSNIFIDNNNWNRICEVIKLQNIWSKDEENNNPIDEKAKEILKKRTEARKILSKVKNGDSSSEDVLEFDDLISILSSHGNGINIFNVWDLTMYAFDNQFNRMRMLDDYNISIRSILAGAKEINIKHWMGKIK